MPGPLGVLKVHEVNQDYRSQQGGFHLEFVNISKSMFNIKSHYKTQQRHLHVQLKREADSVVVSISVALKGRTFVEKENILTSPASPLVPIRPRVW